MGRKSSISVMEIEITISEYIRKLERLNHKSVVCLFLKLRREGIDSVFLDKLFCQITDTVSVLSFLCLTSNLVDFKSLLPVTKRQNWIQEQDTRIR